MFWRQNIVVVSHIETILEKEDIELEELLDEDDILQECKVQNKKLIDYLVQPSIMDKLVSLVITEPDEQKVIKVRYKYANIACEILTFDIDVITDALISQETLLNKLYSFLETEMPLNPLLSSFFSKTICVLLSKRNEQLVEFLKSKHNFVDLILRHIEISAIAQLLLKFLTFSTMWSGILTWLNEQNIMQRLVSLIDPTLSRDVNENAAQLLCDTIRLSREHMSMMQEDAIPNPLLEVIESVDVISILLNNTFGEKKNEDVIVNGISVLLALLEFKKYASFGSQQLFNSFQLLNQSLQPTSSLRTLVSMSPCNDGPEQMTVLDAERLSISVNNALEAVIPHLHNIHEALMDPPLKPPIKLTTGILDPPLGRSRIEISRLVAVLISTNTHIINMQLAKFGTVIALLNLFFKYKWNNFLHTQVELIIKRIILNSPTVNEEGNKVNPLLNQLLVDCQITHKILECFSEQDQNLPDKTNGYMGHLTKIANHVSQAMETGVNSLIIENTLKDSPGNHYEEWKTFVDNTLSDINAKNNTPLIDMSTINTSDPFAFNDKLIESDESLPDHLNLAEVSFSNETNIFQRQVNLEDNIFQKHIDLEENIFQKGEELFEQVCQEKCRTSSPSEDVDSDEDVWVKDEKEIPFIQQNCHEDEDSSDSDDEKQSHNSNAPPLPSIMKTYDIKNMDIESQNTWTSNLDNVPMDTTPITASNPWETVERKPCITSSEQDNNWADFSNFASFSMSSLERTSQVDSVTVAMDTSDGCSSKCFPDSEISSTANTNISQDTPPSNNLSCESSETVYANKDVISKVNNDCDNLSCNFSSVEPDPNNSAIEKDEHKEPEVDNDCLKTEVVVTGQYTSAIVENGPT